MLLFYLGTKTEKMSGPDEKDRVKSLDSLKSSLDDLKSSLGEFSRKSQMPFDIDEKIESISRWVEEQKVSSESSARKEVIENMNKVVTATVSGVQKGDAVSGTLEIISGVTAFVGEVIGGTAGAAVSLGFGTLWSVIGAIFTAKNPQKPTVVEQVFEVVHKELVDFNDRVQAAKYKGLQGRVEDQMDQLRTMKPGDKLDDKALWKDYITFMRELSDRFESPLPYKYSKGALTKDADVNDFVRALMKYCQAYGLYMAHLLVAKGKFAELRSELDKKREGKVDEKIKKQQEEAKAKLAFLSDEKYLTFLGRLPSEGGKLTKIVAFSRNAEARRLVKKVTRRFVSLRCQIMIQWNPSGGGVSSVGEVKGGQI